MQNRKKLIIIINGRVIRFLLVGVTTEASKLLAWKLVPLYYFRKEDFSLTKYIIEALEFWGKEIDFTFVKNKTVTTSKNGLEDVYILADSWDKSLNNITKHVFFIKDELSSDGVKRLLNLRDFENLLFVEASLGGVSITRIIKGKNGNIRVVNEGEKYKDEQIFSDQDILAGVNIFRNELDGIDSLEKIINLCSEIQVPAPSLSNLILKFIINRAKLLKFSNTAKLAFELFGRGEIEKNLLVIGGSDISLYANIELFLLSIITSLAINGNFKILIDRYSLLGFMLRSQKPILTDEIFSNLLFSDWGQLIKVNCTKRIAQKDEVVADAKLLEEENEKQIIPMAGRLVRLSPKPGSRLNLNLKSGYEIAGKNKIDFEDISGNLVIDARCSGKLKKDKKEADAQRLIRYLKEIEALESK